MALGRAWRPVSIAGGHISTRLYLRNTTANVGSVLATEQSNKTATVANNAIHDLSTTAGTAQTSVALTSTASTTTQYHYFGAWVSAAVAVTSITANTWTIGVAASESNANANEFLQVSFYFADLTADPTGTVFPPVGGYTYDSDTDLGTAWATTETGRVVTVSGNAAPTLTAGHTWVLRVEIWGKATQSKATAYTDTLFYDGTTDPVNATAASSAASYIETPQDLFTAVAAVSAPFAPRPQRHVRMRR